VLYFVLLIIAIEAIFIITWSIASEDYLRKRPLKINLIRSIYIYICTKLDLCVPYWALSTVLSEHFSVRRIECVHS